MKKVYICAKIITAYPKDKDDKPGYAIEYPGGYTTWCPKQVFEETYRRITTEEKDMISDVEG